MEKYLKTSSLDKIFILKYNEMCIKYGSDDAGLYKYITYCENLRKKLKAARVKESQQNT